MKTLFKWFLCAAMGILLLGTGSTVLGDQARSPRRGDMPTQPAIEQPAMEQPVFSQPEITQPEVIHTELAQPANTQPTSDGVLLVNAFSLLPEGYAVSGLVNLYGEKRSFQLATSDIYLTRETFEAANRMFKQAQQDGVGKFTITSGYRTWEKQRELYQNTVNGTAAKPGTSEHQTGLAFDVTTRYDSGCFADTEQFRWLSEHCWDFGFIIRYPEGKETITGIPYEPWHYRYVGVDIAREIYESGLTLEEYCERNVI